MPAAPIRITLDDFKFEWDDDEENVILTLSGEDGQDIKVVVEREMCEDMTEEMSQFLGIDGDGEDDD